MFKQLKNWLKTKFCCHVYWRWQADDEGFGQHKTCVNCGFSCNTLAEKQSSR